MMKAPRLLALMAALFVAGAEGATDLSKWTASYDPATKTRFIPVELWTGGDWDGSRDVKMAPANLTFGRRGEKRIEGPRPWKRPGTGEVMQVYERTDRGKQQLFTLTSRGDGLGRVFDSRYGRDCVDEVKFPVGLWKEGETRVFDVSCNNGSLRRRLELTIEKLDFEHKGVPHSIRFHWVVDGGTSRGTDMRYVYSPLRGLVDVQGNE